MISPFDTGGVTRGPDGIKRYEGLPRSLVHMLRDTVERHPQREALAETGGGPRLTYGELWDRATRVAGGLREGRIARGDRVAIHLTNGVDWVLAFFGTVLAGGIVVPVNTRFTENEMNYVVSDSGAAYVFRDGEPLPDGEPYVTEDPAPDDPAAIFYTSGTTGFPKGAITTHENFLSNCETCRRILRLAVHGSGLRTLVSVPLFHVTGCNSQLLVAVYLGGATVIMPQFEVGAFLQAIEAERIDVLTTVPAIYWLAINHPRFAETDVSTVTTLSYGGAPIAPELVARIMKAFPGARVGKAAGDCPDVRRRLAAHRRPRPYRRGRTRLHRRPGKGHDQPGRRERVLRRGGEHACRRAGRIRGSRGRRAGRGDGREGRGGAGAGARQQHRRTGGPGLPSGANRRLQGAAVHRRPVRPVAPQPRRQAAQAASTRRDRLGLASPPMIHAAQQVDRTQEARPGHLRRRGGGIRVDHRDPLANDPG